MQLKRLSPDLGHKGYTRKTDFALLEAACNAEGYDSYRCSAQPHRPDGRGVVPLNSMAGDDSFLPLVS